MAQQLIWKTWIIPDLESIEEALNAMQHSGYVFHSLVLGDRGFILLGSRFKEEP